MIAGKSNFRLLQISVEVSRACPSRITVEFFRTKVTFRIRLYKVCAFKKKRQPTAISILLATLPAFRREECGFLQSSEASGPPTRRYPIAVVINSHNVARLSLRPPAKVFIHVEARLNRHLVPPYRATYQERIHHSSTSSNYCS
ncbi:uncharacterized protein LOC134206631 [Armigeres subalbatus]|uniref:uncharacterized protein LOC134206631 n=1 Tax=Armigeres subalbatus TaxID=124917 RepID=UPI002ED3F788